MQANDGAARGMQRPLSSEPQSPEEAVIMLLMQAGRRLRTRHPEDSVDPSTFPIAKILMEGSMRLSDVANRCELDASTISRQIKQLEDKGLIERMPDPADRRASLVTLSAEGQATMRAAFRRRFERIKAALEPWSEADRAQLQTLLTRLANDLAAANERAASDRVTDEPLPRASDSPQTNLTTESVTR